MREVDRINVKQVDTSFLKEYDTIPMQVLVNKKLQLEKVDGGLGGILLREVFVSPYIKDLGKYEVAQDYEKRFDITNWRFFAAFDEEEPVGACTLVCRTPGVNMLDGREDLCVLWDIRVRDSHKRKGIGQKLFDAGVEWARKEGFSQMKIECQNNNVPACHFYHKQGAELAQINEYAYYGEEEIQDEVQFIWYLDLWKDGHGRK